MKTTISISHKIFPVSAIVFHADTYGEARDVWDNLPADSFLCTDTVYKTATDAKDHHLKIDHHNLPVYRTKRWLLNGHVNIGQTNPSIPNTQIIYREQN